MMKFSTRGRYGMRAMVDLAMYFGKGSVLLKDVAKRQDVSLKYLEQLVTPLRAAGLVRGVRGARGGYTVTRDPKEIKLLEIINALEGEPVPVECVTKCSSEMKCISGCATRELWSKIYLAINNVLENSTLAELAERQQELTDTIGGANVYYI